MGLAFAEIEGQGNASRGIRGRVQLDGHLREHGGGQQILSGLFDRRGATLIARMDQQPFAHIGGIRMLQAH